MHVNHPSAWLDGAIHVAIKFQTVLLVRAVQHVRAAKQNMH
jgi:hypothetical protein